MFKPLFSGMEEQILQDCPIVFSGYFWYTLTDTTGTYCDSTSVWDGCASKQQMSFNYTQCVTKVAYSGNVVHLLAIQVLAFTTC